jgi:hypothetical protein
MKKIICIAVLFNLIFLISCKKNSEKTTTINISAIAVDYTTKQPIPGLKLFLVTGGYRLVFFSEPWNILSADTTTTTTTVINYLSKDSTFTDVNGRFSFQFTPFYVPLEGWATPRIILADGVLLRVFPSVYSNDIDDTNLDTLFTDTKSFLVINMQKSSPAFPNDTVFQRRNFLSSSPQPVKNYIALLKGQVGLANRTITDAFSYSLSKKAEIEWRYYRNGLQSSHIDTINLVPYGITVFNISY